MGSNGSWKKPETWTQNSRLWWQDSMISARIHTLLRMGWVFLDIGVQECLPRDTETGPKFFPHIRGFDVAPDLRLMRFGNSCINIGA